MAGPSLLLQFSFETRLAQEIEEGLTKQGGQALSKGLCKTIDPDDPLDIGEILCAMPPDSACDLELDDSLERGKSEAGHLHEGAGFWRRIHDGTFRGARVLSGGHDINVYLVLDLTETLPQPRSSRDQSPSDEGGVKLFQTLGSQQKIYILGVADIAIMAKGQGADNGERDLLLRETAAQRFEGSCDVVGVHEIPPELFDERSLDSPCHGVIFTTPRTLLAKEDCYLP